MAAIANSAISRVVRRLADVRIVPVLSADDPDQAEACCQALMAGGLSCVEITFRTDAAAKAIRRVSGIEGLLVGAGTVLSPNRAQAASEAGARFAAAPGTNESVVQACRELDLPFFPGVATPTEIDRAPCLGVHTLKVFPASTIGGVGFLKAVSAAIPTSPLSQRVASTREHSASIWPFPASSPAAAAGLSRMVSCRRAGSTRSKGWPERRRSW